MQGHMNAPAAEVRDEPSARAMSDPALGGTAVAPLVSVDGVSVRKRGFKILDGVSLQVARGDFITIIGPNGAGKSTLIKSILGLVRPDEGRVRRAPGLSAGYVPQRFAPNPHMPASARDFLMIRRRSAAAAVLEAVQDAGAAGILDKPMHSLSGGEMQRVLLARALAASPSLLALDEPAQSLDAGGQLAFFRLLEALHKRRGMAVLMVSHDLHMVMSATRRVVCLNRSIRCSGAPQAVAQRPEFAELFGGEWARTFAVYRHAHSGGGAPSEHA